MQCKDVGKKLCALVKGVQAGYKLRECMVFESKGSCLCCVTQGV